METINNAAEKGSVNPEIVTLTNNVMEYRIIAINCVLAVLKCCKILYVK
jgi:hypothetical protein